MSLQLYNTLARNKEEFVPIDPSLVRLYVCGMTVQDRPHIGHMRAYIVSDILKRWLAYKGFKVKHIQNFTDIDDKIIDRSRVLGIDYRELAEENIEEFMNCCDLIGIKRADFYPRATQHIQEIVELISKLVEKGYGYITETGVYFEISRFPYYAKLSGKQIPDLIEGARVEIDERKRSPLDFVLWKLAKQGEPYWESPWGRGRPGWHIECSAMCITHLGESIDIHTGGEDLIFPHHENEIAQSEAATKTLYVRFWIHNGLLQFRGYKMSKSTGQFVPALDILKRYDPSAVRMFFLSTHYRHPMECSEQGLIEGERALSRIRECLWMLKERKEGKELKEKLAIHRFWNDFISAMDDDLNTPKAVARIYSLIKEINSRTGDMDNKTASLYKETLTSALNLLGIKVEEKGQAEVTPKLLDTILEIRKKLRKDGEYSLADRIREQLSQLGITIQDTEEGSIWRI